MSDFIDASARLTTITEYKSGLGRIFHSLMNGRKSESLRNSFTEYEQRSLITPDELKSLPKGNFIVSKTGCHLMKTKLKLFLKWRITFEEPYEIEEKSARKVAYADKQEIEEEIIRRYMCCMEEESDHTEQNTTNRNGGMQQTQKNETVAKARQTLRTED